MLPLFLVCIYSYKWHVKIKMLAVCSYIIPDSGFGEQTKVIRVETHLDYIRQTIRKNLSETQTNREKRKWMLYTTAWVRVLGTLHFSVRFLLSLPVSRSRLVNTKNLVRRTETGVKMHLQIYFSTSFMNQKLKSKDNAKWHFRWNIIKNKDFIAWEFHTEAWKSNHYFVSKLCEKGKSFLSTIFKLSLPSPR